MSAKRQPRELQDLGHGIHLVPLTQGKFALIDSADAEVVGRHRWTASLQNGRFYAVRRAGLDDIKDGYRLRQYILMHRLLCPSDAEVDHRDCDSLDNRRANLRPASRLQNLWNTRTRRDSASGHKGVYFDRHRNLWQASIKDHGVRLFLGRFKTVELAQAAYSEAATRLRGEFARSA
jgi:hypothetical protein